MSSLDHSSSNDIISDPYDIHPYMDPPYHRSHDQTRQDDNDEPKIETAMIVQEQKIDEIQLHDWVYTYTYIHVHINQQQQYKHHISSLSSQCMYVVCCMCMSTTEDESLCS